jgi:hypothetical protein
MRVNESTTFRSAFHRPVAARSDVPSMLLAVSDDTACRTTTPACWRQGRVAASRRVLKDGNALDRVRFGRPRTRSYLRLRRPKER